MVNWGRGGGDRPYAEKYPFSIVWTSPKSLKRRYASFVDYPKANSLSKRKARNQPLLPTANNGNGLKILEACIHNKQYLSWLIRYNFVVYWVVIAFIVIVILSRSISGLFSFCLTMFLLFWLHTYHTCFLIRNIRVALSLGTLSSVSRMFIFLLKPLHALA